MKTLYAFTLCSFFLWGCGLFEVDLEKDFAASKKTIAEVKPIFYLPLVSGEINSINYFFDLKEDSSASLETDPENQQLTLVSKATFASDIDKIFEASVNESKTFNLSDATKVDDGHFEHSISFDPFGRGDMIKDFYFSSLPGNSIKIEAIGVNTSGISVTLVGLKTKGVTSDVTFDNSNFDTEVPLSGGSLQLSTLGKIKIKATLPPGTTISGQIKMTLKVNGFKRIIGKFASRVLNETKIIDFGIKNKNVALSLDEMEFKVTNPYEIDLGIYLPSLEALDVAGKPISGEFKIPDASYTGEFNGNESFDYAPINQSLVQGGVTVIKSQSDIVAPVANVRYKLKTVLFPKGTKSELLQTIESGKTVSAELRIPIVGKIDRWDVGTNENVKTSKIVDSPLKYIELVDKQYTIDNTEMTVLIGGENYYPVSIVVEIELLGDGNKPLEGPERLRTLKIPIAAASTESNGVVKPGLPKRREVDIPGLVIPNLLKAKAFKISAYVTTKIDPLDPNGPDPDKVNFRGEKKITINVSLRGKSKVKFTTK